MNTELYKIDAHNIDAAAKEILTKAGSIIREGGLVAFPTETVYGLGGDALKQVWLFIIAPLFGSALAYFAYKFLSNEKSK